MENQSEFNNEEEFDVIFDVGCKLIIFDIKLKRISIYLRVFCFFKL